MQRLTVAETAHVMGVTEQFVRVGLQRKILPFGIALKINTRYTYHISPSKLCDYLGITSDALASELRRCRC